MAQPLQREPLYRQIYNQLEARIVSGELRVGDTLPSETELAENYGVHRSSVREALRLLEENDLVGRAPGKKKLTVTTPNHENLPRRISTSMLIDQVTLDEVYGLKVDECDGLTLLERAEKEKLLREGMKNLSPRDRLFMKLHFDQGLSAAEVAAAMQVSVENVYTIKNRAIQRLKAQVASATGK